MREHIVIVSARVLFFISAALGLGWWVLFVQQGLFDRVAPEAYPILVGFVVAQVLVWGLVAGVLWLGHRPNSRGLQVGSMVVALLLVLGSVLFYVTTEPAALILAIAGLIAALLLIVRRRHHDA